MQPFNRRVDILMTTDLSKSTHDNTGSNIKRIVKSIGLGAVIIFAIAWAYYSFSTPQTPSQPISVSIKDLAFRFRGSIRVDQTGSYHVVLNITVIDNSTKEVRVLKSEVLLRDITLPDGHVEQVNDRLSDEKGWILTNGSSYLLSLEFGIGARPTKANLVLYIYLEAREDPIYTGFSINFEAP